MSARAGDMSGERELAAVVKGARGFGSILNRIVPNKDPERERLPHRWSYDVNDPRAQVFRPVGDGTAAAKNLDMGVMLQVFDETLQEQRLNKYRRDGRLQDIDRRVLLALLKFRSALTGRLDLEYKEIAKYAGVAISTAKAACMRLAKWLGLRWVRRTVLAETAGQKGPQRKQTSNAYYFDFTALPSRVLARWKAAIKRAFTKKGKIAPAVASRRESPLPSGREANPIWNPLVRYRLEADGRRARAERMALNQELKRLEAAFDTENSANPSDSFYDGVA